MQFHRLTLAILTAATASGVSAQDRASQSSLPSPVQQRVTVAQQAANDLISSRADLSFAEIASIQFMANSVDNSFKSIARRLSGQDHGSVKFDGAGGPLSGPVLRSRDKQLLKYDVVYAAARRQHDAAYAAADAYDRQAASAGIDRNSTMSIADELLQLRLKDVGTSLRSYGTVGSDGREVLRPGGEEGVLKEINQGLGKGLSMKAMVKNLLPGFANNPKQRLTPHSLF